MPVTATSIARTIAGVAVGASVATYVSSYTTRPVPPRLLALQAAGRFNTQIATGAATIGVLTRSRTLTAAGIGAAALWAGRATWKTRQAQHVAADNVAADLTVVSANTLWENRRHAEVADCLAGCGTDVIISVESTTPQREALEAAFKKERQRWVLATDIDPERDTQPAMYVREHLLVNSWMGELGERTVTFAALDINNKRVIVAGTHIQSPAKDDDRQAWREQLEALPRLLNGRMHPVVLAGDFNASTEHQPMRALLRHLTDAATACGRRWQPTWPAGPSESTRLSTPLLDLDHILVSDGVSVCDFDTFTVPGADHLAVRARLRFGERTKRANSWQSAFRTAT